ncbi:unnamed protein product, partial [Discosporangium mesarthrocarpum]
VSPSLRSRAEKVHSHDPTGVLGTSGAPAPEPSRSSEATRAANALIELLHQGHALVEALSDEDYAASLETKTQAADATWASPGAHTRHLLDFVDCLLDGLDAQRIDYTARKRRSEVETRREAGRRQLERALEALECLRELEGRMPLEVRPEPGQDWTRSSLSRELQFISTHVIHHHALIRLTLTLRGIEAPAEFGVAPSTVAYRAESDR